MKNLNTNANNTNAKGEKAMRRESKFKIQGQTSIEKAAGRISSMYEDYKTSEELMLPAQIRFADIKDVVKLLSGNYAIADATGVVTEGVNRTLNAKTMKELSRCIDRCGEEGTSNKTGKRYVSYKPLIRSVKVIPRLGGGTAVVEVCSKYEVQEFFNKRIPSLDLNACTVEDLKAIQDDMQVIGRVLQEIAIDIAKDKSLDPGVDLKKVFKNLPVLSRLRRKSETGIVDNTKEISIMINDAVAKNPVINTGVKIDSIPYYSISTEKFEKDFIMDWASVLQDKLIEATQECINTQIMEVAQMAGATEEALEAYQLRINNGECIDEMTKIMDSFNHYVRSLNNSDHAHDEMNIRVSKAKATADKEVKAAFRDTLYAIGAAYGHDQATTRKLVYAATMTGGVHTANIGKAMNVLGEDDMLLMWSNEEGVAVEPVKIDLVEVFVELFDEEELSEMAVEFKDDIAYNEAGEEVAYGIGMEALNGKGVIIAQGNDFLFLPEKRKTIAPIGNRRIAFLNTLNHNGVITKIANKGERVVADEDVANTKSALLYASTVYFIPETKDGIERAVGVVVNVKDQATGQIRKESLVLGTTLKVGNEFVKDMFIDYKEVNGELKQTNNKKHQVDQVIETAYGLLLVLAC